MTTEATKSRKVTTRRPRYAPLEKAAAEVCALVLDGAGDTQIAEWFGTKRESVGRFKDRHRADLEVMRAEVERLVTDYAIAQKVNRIAALDERWARMKALIDARASDSRYSGEPGYETGLMVHQLKAVGKGDDFQLVDLYVTDSGLLSEMRATERAAAEELAQLPRAETNIHTAPTYILQVVGASDRIPLG